MLVLALCLFRDFFSVGISPPKKKSAELEISCLRTGLIHSFIHSIAQHQTTTFDMNV